jgi:uncharacterized protein (TIGR02217 family)
MAFHDTKLSDAVERGAQGGPHFKTNILMLSSGFEKRNIEWERTKGEWDVGYGIDTKEAYSEVLTFFYARQGRAHSFRFKDWSDFEIGDDPTPQEIGVGDTVALTFQIEKRYSNGGYTFHRPIYKPVSGTLRVFFDGVEQFGNWSANYLTGVITFTSPPAGSVSVGVICEFDVPVRFDTDVLNINVEIFSAGAVPQISLVEVRGE